MALGEAAREHDSGVVFLIDEVHFLTTPELGALIAALHKTVQRQLPITLVGAGLPQRTTTGLTSPAPDRRFARHRATERCDLVVIDTAPIGVVLDSFALLGKVDGVIGVSRMGRSTRDSMRKLREQLDRLDAPVLGIVANRLKLRRRRKYGYGYGYAYYGHYGKEPAQQQAGAAVATDSGTGEQA